MKYTAIFLTCLASLTTANAASNQGNNFDSDLENFLTRSSANYELYFKYLEACKKNVNKDEAVCTSIEIKFFAIVSDTSLSDSDKDAKVAELANKYRQYLDSVPFSKDSLMVLDQLKFKEKYPKLSEHLLNLSSEKSKYLYDLHEELYSGKYATFEEREKLFLEAVKKNGDFVPESNTGNSYRASSIVSLFCMSLVSIFML